MYSKKLSECVVCKDSSIEDFKLSSGDKIFRCLGCGLEWRLSQPNYKELKSLYGKKYFFQSGELKKGYPNYDAVRDSMRSYFKQQLSRIKIEADQNNGVMVDIGCGPGMFLDEARSSGFKVVGVDISQEVAELAWERYKIPVRVGEFEKILFKNQKFDVITSFQTFEHVRSPIKFLNKAYKLLKPGGILLVTTPDADSLWRLVLGNRWFSYRHLEHLYFWKRSNLSKALDQVGFEGITFFTDSWRKYSLAEMLLLMSAYGGRFGQMMPQVNGVFSRLLRIPFPIGSVGVLAYK